MRILCIFLLLAGCALAGSAATNGTPVKLAIIPESPEAATAADVLTAEFTKNSRVQLLERAEIEKVYHEQGLSAANKDYLKLGQVLGADGLLLLNVASVPTPINVPTFGASQKTLSARMVAVKPGVILMDGNVAWPVKDMAQWSESFAEHLDSFLPKLHILAKDAIPISVVNLRSAIQSDEEKETEQALKSLAIQWLSEEPQFFVLERQQMQLSTEEKALQSDESAFWNGSYLLDGVIDQNGYARDVITINVRLTPPKGGEPLSFQVSGNRTNFGEVINLMALKVTELLKLNSAAKEWNTADEATQYFDEAQWALRWGMISEAQMAADSAWALGKKDLECANLRIESYLDEIPKIVPDSITYYSNGKLDHSYVHINQPPNPMHCKVALVALKSYYDFSQISPDGRPEILTRGKGWNDWHDSEWYRTGVADLEAASHVLQHFYFHPESQGPVADKLSELRRAARMVAELIRQSPSVDDSYYVGSRIATRDELVHTIEENPNIFRCEVQWGCFWQERPEDEIALYRDLMSSPVFCYIHKDFWHRETLQPRLIGWHEEDKKRIPFVWANFVHELEQSTNVLLRMEAKALIQADTTNDDLARAASDGWWSLVRSNREELVANNVELFYLGWGIASNPETDAMDREYWEKTVPAGETTSAFEKQKQYLASFTPFEFNNFINIFSKMDYTKSQAAELKPLIAAYKSNLVARASTGDTNTNARTFQNFMAQANVRRVEFFLERHVDEILKAPAPVVSPSMPAPKPQVPPITSPPALAAQKSPPKPVAGPPAELVTNVLTVTKFLPIPLEGLPGDQISGVTITAHHWAGGRLVLDLQYGAFVYSFDDKGNWKSTRSVNFTAIAILDPVAEHWQVIPCPEVPIVSENRFYHHTVVYRGEVFTSNGGQLRKFDAAKNTWQVLELPNVGNCELFEVNGRLYAATSDSIVEILDGGASTHILASNRRQPPASALDAEDLGVPALFPGPAGSLWASVGNKIVAWGGEDWRTICPAPRAPLPPVISDDGVLFLADGWNAPAGIWRLAAKSERVEFCLGSGPRNGTSAVGSGLDNSAKATWEMPKGFSLPKLPAASRGPDLYLMVDHAVSQDAANEQGHFITGKKILPQDGYHAELLCFAANHSTPQKIFLKFDGEDLSLPVTGDRHPAGFMFPNLPSSWFLFSSNYLYFGRETSDALPSSGGDPRISYPKTGIWMISLEQIDPEIIRQKKAQQEQLMQSDAAAKRAVQALIEKYDLNHNGVIDPDERENALDDPAFIKTCLSEIDTNHNGWLDAPELSWFDANQNKILDPKEQAGIELAQQMLDGKILDQFDREGNGWLSRNEYEEMVQLRLQINPNADFDLQFAHADSNHDNHIDLEELEALMQRQLEKSLRHGRMMRPVFHAPMGLGGLRPPVGGQDIKATVEAYWQNPGGATNLPSMGRRIPSGADNP